MIGTAPDKSEQFANALQRQSVNRFEAMKSVLEKSRWFDASWMSLSQREGYPALGTFGLRSGPDFEAYTFYHDLAHAMIAVQDNQSTRLDQYGFGLKYTTTIEVMGEEYEHPVTDQGVQLELRVIALQFHLTSMDALSDPILNTKGHENFFADHVRPLKYMEDFLTTQRHLREAGLTGNLRPHGDKEQAFTIGYLIQKCRQMAESIDPDSVVALWEETCRIGRELQQADDAAPKNE